MTASRKLAAAVFVQAFKDAGKGCPKARQWLLEDTRDFSWWCKLYGIDPERARASLRRSLSGNGAGCLNRQEKREAVLRALREHPELSNREIGRRLGVSYDLVGKVRQGR